MLPGLITISKFKDESAFIIGLCVVQLWSFFLDEEDLDKDSKRKHSVGSSLSLAKTNGFKVGS